MSSVQLSDAYVRSDLNERRTYGTSWIVVVGVLVFVVVGVSIFVWQMDQTGNALDQTESSPVAAQGPTSPAVPRDFTVPENLPWAEGEQFAWQAATGLTPVTIDGVRGYSRLADQEALVDDPFGTAPVYELLSPDGTLGEQIGVWTNGLGTFSMAEVSDPTFDLRAIALEEWGPERVYYVEHAGELPCEETASLLPEALPCS